MPLTKPLNNNVLIEVLRNDEGVARAGDNESLQFGKLIDFAVSSYHITASAAIEFNPEFITDISIHLKNKVGQIVRWEEFAEGGQTFKEDKKTYALIPWWRLISYEEETK